MAVVAALGDIDIAADRARTQGGDQEGSAGGSRWSLAWLKIKTQGG